MSASTQDNYLWIRWENAKTKRYYLCALEYDLLGDLLLTSCYGSLTSDAGQLKKSAMKSLNEAQSIIKSLMSRRRQHGYQIKVQKNSFLGLDLT